LCVVETPDTYSPPLGAWGKVEGTAEPMAKRNRRHTVDWRESGQNCSPVLSHRHKSRTGHRSPIGPYHDAFRYGSTPSPHAPLPPAVSPGQRGGGLSYKLLALFVRLCWARGSLGMNIFFACLCAKGLLCLKNRIAFSLNSTKIGNIKSPETRHFAVCRLSSPPRAVHLRRPRFASV